MVVTDPKVKRVKSVIQDLPDQPVVPEVMEAKVKKDKRVQQDLPVVPDLPVAPVINQSSRF